jgi:Sulfotransferase domain
VTTGRVDCLRRSMRNLPIGLGSPFSSKTKPLLVHCSYHRAGTVWFWKILGGVARHYRLNLQVGDNAIPDARAEIVLYLHGYNFTRDALAGRGFRGTHIIRDPRDVVLSSYHYHLRSDEKWVKRPDARWGGLGLQDYLKSLNPRDGLLFEIRRLLKGPLSKMTEWDYSQPEFLELRYEDVIANEEEMFLTVFRHFEFRDRAMSTGLALVRENSISRKASWNEQRQQHVRSGRPGAWREEFGPEHVALFKELSGSLLVRLGYEKDVNWQSNQL